MARIAGQVRRLGAFAATPTAAVVGTIALTNLVRIVSSAILTRLLTASDYGVVGIITSVTYVVAMLSDFGFFAFLVRHERGDDPEFLDEVWTVRLVRSFAITAILIALAIPYAGYSGKPLLAPVIAVWSLNQVLDGFSSLAFAQAVRGGQVQRLSWMEFGLNLFQVAVTIVLALVFHNYWAIVAAVLTGGALKVVLSYTLFPHARRRWRPSRARAGEIWRFSRFIAGSSILTLLLGQADKVVLSRALPLALFGIYSLAILLALAPRALVYPYCNRILYPAYAARFRAAALDGFAEVFYATRRLVSRLYMFAIGGVIGSAPLIVAVLYDPRYAEVAPLMRIVAISAMLLMNNTAAEQAMIAIGRTGAPFQMNLARLGWLAIGGAGGFAAAGPVGLIWAAGTVEVAALLYSWLLLARIGVLRLREEIVALGFGGVGVASGLVIADAILSLGWF